MPFRAASTRIAFTLVLALLMAWVGHTYSLLSAASQQGAVVEGHSHSVEGHSHSHDIDSDSCVACGDHYHAPFTADHVHETPYLGSVIVLPPLIGPAQLQSTPRFTMPTGPIHLIERPPRTTFVL
ncbi:hypothetical protein L682_00115 [Aquipseudomonas alcaligenes OT 69]|nr:hypothetical protein L682_00115 [Pseudomonas alcaligenes OT 69]